MYTRGVVYGIIIVEALRVAQAKYGKGKVMTPEQLRWGLEHLNLTEARIKELGAAGLFPPIKTSCADHEGSGMVKFQQWDGNGFKQVTPFMAGDRALVRKMVEDSRRQVRRGEEHHAARLRQGRLIRRPCSGQRAACLRGRLNAEAARACRPLPEHTYDKAVDMSATPQSAPAAYLSVNNIEVIYDHVILVLKGVSLDVPEGGIVALLGANGAGKTTTLKAISNLLHAERGEVTKGTIEFAGKRVDKLTPNDLVRMGVCQVMEGRHCFPHLTVEENLLTGAFTRKGSRGEIAAALEQGLSLLSAPARSGAAASPATRRAASSR